MPTSVPACKSARKLTTTPSHRLLRLCPPTPHSSGSAVREHFVGRDDDLDRIATTFVNHQAVVIAGGAGMGKSQLAAEYVYRTGLHGFWTPAGDTVDRTLAALAPQLGVQAEGLTERDLAIAARARLHNLGPESPWAVDNVGDITLVAKLMEAAGPVHLLVTTRDARGQLLPPMIQMVRLAVLSEEFAIALLVSRRDRASWDPADPPTDQALHALARELGRLPLALEALAGRLDETGQTPPRALEDIRQRPHRAQYEVFQRSLERWRATIDRPDSVFEVLASALNALSAEHRQAIQPLGFLADAPIPLPLAAALTGLDGARVDELLEAGRQQSLWEVNEGQGTVSVHGLTLSTIAALSRDDALEYATRRSYGRLLAIREADPVALRLEIVHHDALLERLRHSIGNETDPVLPYATALGIGYRTLGRTDDAIALDEETLRNDQGVLGLEHPQYPLRVETILRSAIGTQVGMTRPSRCWNPRSSQ